MGYKVYKKDTGGKSVKVVNNKVYDTREEAEAAMSEAENDQKDNMDGMPLPAENYKPGENQMPGQMPGQNLFTGEADGLGDSGKSQDSEAKSKFFIREV